MTKKYYIKERNNPQLGIYYVKMGQMSKSEAREYDSSLYGFNTLLSFDTEEQYNTEIDRLRQNGERVW